MVRTFEHLVENCSFLNFRNLRRTADSGRPRLNLIKGRHDDLVVTELNSQLMKSGIQIPTKTDRCFEISVTIWPSGEQSDQMSTSDLAIVSAKIRRQCLTTSCDYQGR